MDELEERYNRALENSRRSYRYILRLRICVLEGVRSAFYDYATKKADELEDIQRTLYLHTGINWSRQLEGELNNFNDPELINDPEISSEHFQVSDVPEVNDLEDEDDRYSDTSYHSESDTDFEEIAKIMNHFLNESNFLHTSFTHSQKHGSFQSHHIIQKEITRNALHPF